MKKTSMRQPQTPNRRDFLKGASMATLMGLMGGIPLRAEQDSEETPTKPGPPVNCAVIGLGPQGRELLSNLSRLPNAPIVAVCDTYEPMLNRARKLAPQAEPYSDYQQVLANPKVKAVLVATPTHRHREIVLAALLAGKHVYCEAPLAHTIEDARAIAQAARAALKLNFQAGLHSRADGQHDYVRGYFLSGATGNIVKARCQWAAKTDWRRPSPNPDREKEANWRLDKGLSLGLAGEVGIHQLDLVSWYLRARPVAVTGFGSIQRWSDDGREVPDTVQAVVEYPGKVNLVFDATLTGSFDASGDMFCGTFATVMFRGLDCWMFKETDSPLLGWEVYARKEQVHREAGIIMRADASKLPKPGQKAPWELPLEPAISKAMKAFIKNTNTVIGAVEDYAMAYGTTTEEEFRIYLNGLNRARLPAAGWREGFEATVTALKINEAIVMGQKVIFDPAWFVV